ncbi:hypothetical protein SDC9_199961 [bioreactor metagenome]|uniref:Coenzyme F420 hydrogenase/dehydrogenase beta subunit C-terminal domain-containing protein n=1 Tax=bioreactor metagenome TaxID=1076179 RepID=A0A645ILW0_9ZZZZ
MHYYLKIITQTRVKYEYAWADPYYNAFLAAQTFRESCYRCPYARAERPGDFTVGDYWGIEKVHPQVDKTNGVSLLLVNTRKAEEIIKELDSLQVYPSTLENAVNNQGNLRRPSARSAVRDTIYREIETEGYAAWAKKYFHSRRYFKSKLICTVAMMIPPEVRKQIKHIIGL